MVERLRKDWGGSIALPLLLAPHMLRTHPFLRVAERWVPKHALLFESQSDGCFLFLAVAYAMHTARDEKGCMRCAEHMVTLFDKSYQIVFYLLDANKLIKLFTVVCEASPSKS